MTTASVRSDTTDQDRGGGGPGIAQRSDWYTRYVAVAVASHENSGARCPPRVRNRSAASSESRTCSIAARIAWSSSGSNSSAASPTISGRAPDLLHTTGQPKVIASSGGRPNPSYSDG